MKAKIEQSVGGLGMGWAKETKLAAAGSASGEASASREA